MRLTLANEIVTVNRPSGLYIELSVLKWYHKQCGPPLRDQVNAATVLLNFGVLCESRALTSMLPLMMTVIGSMEGVGVHYIGVKHTADCSAPREGI